MDKLELQKLRDLPIEGVAERLGLRVTRHKALCPFHDDHHASLSFNLRTNTVRCFVCGEHGGTIDLALKLLPASLSLPSGRYGGDPGSAFKDACRWLADSNNMIMDEWKPATTETRTNTFDARRYEGFFLHPWLSDAALHFLYAERLLDERVVRWCRITSWRDRNGVNWLQTPYYDINGKLIGVQNRRLDPLPASAPRFKFPYGSQCSIYNLPVLKLLKEGEPLFVTEGCSDCWAMLSAGHKAIAIPSATLLKPQDVELLLTLRRRRKTVFHMYPDQDVPGERLFLQLREMLGRDGEGGEVLVHHQLPPDCKDFGDYYVTMKRKGATV